MVETTEPRDIRQLLREIAHEYHHAGSIRDHADPNDKTGWNVHGIETCEDVYCVEARAVYSADEPLRPTSVIHEDGPEHERWEPCTLPADHRHRCRTIEPKPTSRDSEVREAIEALYSGQHTLWKRGDGLSMGPPIDCIDRAEVLAILDRSSEAPTRAFEVYEAEDGHRAIRPASEAAPTPLAVSVGTLTPVANTEDTPSGVCPSCQEIAHDRECPLVGDGRPVEATPTGGYWDNGGRHRLASETAPVVELRAICVVCGNRGRVRSSGGTVLVGEHDDPAGHLFAPATDFEAARLTQTRTLGTDGAE